GPRPVAAPSFPPPAARAVARRLTIYSDPRSASHQNDHRANGCRYLGRKLLEQVSGGQQRKTKGRSLTRVGEVVKARRKISVPNEPGGGRPRKVRQSGHGVSAVGAIDERKAERVHAPRDGVVAA